ncbi:MAG: hypothetical protein GY754_00220, partial [bacterium]|nr:hypothetical protein [bacterium]
YSITLKSTSKKQTVYTFDKSIAQLRIFHKNNTVITKTIGNDLVRLNLEPGEIKPFVDTIEMGYFNEYAHKNIQAKAKQRKTLFSFDDNTVTFKAVLTLNTGENVSMETNFTHEVSQ